MNSVLRRNLAKLQCALKKDLNFNTGNCFFTRNLNIGVQGAGYGGGQPKSGLIHGPELIRGSGFIQFLVDEVGHDIKDYGDLTFDETRDKSPTIVEGCVPLNNVGSISRANFQIYESTRKILSDNRVPLTLGGDHSISIGTLAAVSEARQDIGILWVDAHADLNTPYTTNSGNLHGLPMGFHVKELAHDFKCLATQFNWLVPRIPAKNIAYIGLREIGGRFNPKAQRENIKRLGIKTYTMGDVDRLGICEPISSKPTLYLEILSLDSGQRIFANICSVRCGDIAELDYNQILDN
ncbi:Arginase-1 [Folsomia candida]|uniref:Arginase-1 n=1 Tax=Folsomia candida TaxID=158441 RepID=A0A226E2D6_FOLCA|nr:Arginase-1 [Folsomia candida]